MVTVFLRGGLGNQMFQYAAGLGVAKRNDTDLVLDTVYLNDRFPRRNFTYRTFDLDIFAFKPRLTPLSRWSSKFPVPGVWLGVDLVRMKISSAMGVEKIIKEKNEFALDPEVLKVRANLVLWGRWQSERYFSDVAGELRSAFEFRHPLAGGAIEIADDIRSSNSISVHVRRGDYAAFKSVAQMMGDTDISYYGRAAEYVAARIPQAKFFIFSDDIDWCRANLKLPFPTVYVPASAAGPKAAFHLELMSLCKHNIIVNSTFSWWGAWLNRNPGKIVVAPKRWYADLAASDMVPEQWIRL